MLVKQHTKYWGLGITGLLYSFDVHKFIRAFHECQIFVGRQNVPALFLKPRQVGAYL